MTNKKIKPDQSHKPVTVGKQNQKLKLRISEMDCPDCALAIEKEVSAMPGVKSASVDFLNGFLTVRGPGAKLDEIKARINSLGYTAESIEKKHIKKTVLAIPNMDCPDEERIIRRALSSLDSVIDLQFNLVARKVTVFHSGDASTLLESVRREGFDAELVEAGRPIKDKALPLRRVWIVGR